MGNHWLSPKVLIYVSLLLFLLTMVACGGTSAEPQIIEKQVIVEKEVIKEVPVEKQVIVREEVIKEVIKEVPVDREVIREIIKEVPKEDGGPHRSTYSRGRIDIIVPSSREGWRSEVGF